MLEAMFSGRHPIIKDTDGYYFVDRPSEPFKTILTFLQTGKFHWPRCSTKKDILKEELNYYGLKEVVMPRLEMDSAVLTESLLQFLSECGIGSGQLLYRRSRDGNTAQDFHHLCDDKGPTLTIVKTQQQLIIGGFTERIWNDSGFTYPSPQSWLFAVTYSVPSKFSAKNYAGVYSSPSTGPCFGNFDSDTYDLIGVLLNEGYCRIGGNCAYEAPKHFGMRGTGTYTQYLIEEVEVFQVD
jgi:hypothetical protein